MGESKGILGVHGGDTADAGFVVGIKDGSGGGKQNFVLIGEQPTGRKSTAARQTAEGVRQPGRQAQPWA